jgi:hypothetical protein
VPKTLTSGNTKRGLFTGQDFIYDAEKDHYTCPAGQHLTRGRVRSDRSGDIDQYRHLTACFTCPLKPRCTAEKVKRVKRWKHEDVLDVMQDRLDRMPEAMGVRRQTVEHPFGTLKAWMGATHFLTRTLDKVRTEMSLHVLAYTYGPPRLQAAIARVSDQSAPTYPVSRTKPRPRWRSARPGSHNLVGIQAPCRPSDFQAAVLLSGHLTPTTRKHR